MEKFQKLDASVLEKLTYERSKIWANYIQNLTAITGETEIELDKIDEVLAHENEDLDADNDDDLIAMESEDEDEDDTNKTNILLDITNHGLLSKVVKGQNSELSRDQTLLLSGVKEHEVNELKTLLNNTLPVLENHERRWRESGMEHILNTFDPQKIEEKVGGWLRSNQSNCVFDNISPIVKKPKTHWCHNNAASGQKYLSRPDVGSVSEDSMHSVETAHYIRSSRKQQSSSRAQLFTTRRSPFNMIKTFRLVQSKRDALRKKYALLADPEDEPQYDVRCRRQRTFSTVSSGSCRHQYRHKAEKQQQHQQRLYQTEQRKKRCRKLQLIDRHRSPLSSEATDDDSPSYHHRSAARARARFYNSCSCVACIPTTAVMSTCRARHFQRQREIKRESDCLCCNDDNLCEDTIHLADTSTEEWVVENLKPKRRLLLSAGQDFSSAGKHSKIGMFKKSKLNNCTKLKVPTMDHDLQDISGIQPFSSTVLSVQSGTKAQKSLSPDKNLNDVQQPPPTENTDDKLPEKVKKSAQKKASVTKKKAKAQKLIVEETDSYLEQMEIAIEASKKTYEEAKRTMQIKNDKEKEENMNGKQKSKEEEENASLKRKQKHENEDEENVNANNKNKQKNKITKYEGGVEENVNASLKKTKQRKQVNKYEEEEENVNASLKKTKQEKQADKLEEEEEEENLNVSSKKTKQRNQVGKPEEEEEENVNGSIKKKPKNEVGKREEEEEENVNASLKKTKQRKQVNKHEEEEENVNASLKKTKQGKQVDKHKIEVEVNLNASIKKKPKNEVGKREEEEEENVNTSLKKIKQRNQVGKLEEEEKDTVYGSTKKKQKNQVGKPEEVEEENVNSSLKKNKRNNEVDKPEKEEKENVNDSIKTKRRNQVGKHEEEEEENANAKTKHEDETEHLNASNKSKKKDKVIREEIDGSMNSEQKNKSVHEENVNGSTKIEKKNKGNKKEEKRVDGRIKRQQKNKAIQLEGGEKVKSRNGNESLKRKQKNKATKQEEEEEEEGDTNVTTKSRKTNLLDMKSGDESFIKICDNTACGVTSDNEVLTSSSFRREDSDCTVVTSPTGQLTKQPCVTSCRSPKSILLYKPNNQDSLPSQSIADGHFIITKEHLSSIIGETDACKFLKYYVGRKRFDINSTVYFCPPQSNGINNSATTDSDDDELEFVGKYGDLRVSFTKK